MTEATNNLIRPPDEQTVAGMPARAANGAALRWTPGPDELRLPSSEPEDEHVSQNTRHAVAVEDGFGGLRLHWHGRLDVFVGADQFVYWDRAYDSKENPDNPPMSPDVCVAFGVANRHRSSYVVWEEGKPPDFVLEVASPSSRKRDEKEKRDAYQKMGVPEYFLYDPEGKLKPALSGFELCAGKYRQLPEETFAGGVTGVRSKVLGLCLCMRQPGPSPLDVSLGWYDPATGEFLPTRYELAERKRQADARADASETKAAEAAARAAESATKVAELEALIEKMRRG